MGLGFARWINMDSLSLMQRLGVVPPRGEGWIVSTGGPSGFLKTRRASSQEATFG